MPRPLPGPGDDDATKLGAVLITVVGLVVALLAILGISSPLDGQAEKEERKVCMSVSMNPQDGGDFLCPSNTPPENWQERGCTRASNLQTTTTLWHCPR